MVEKMRVYGYTRPELASLKFAPKNNQFKSYAPNGKAPAADPSKPAAKLPPTPASAAQQQLRAKANERVASRGAQPSRDAPKAYVSGANVPGYNPLRAKQPSAREVLARE